MQFPTTRFPRRTARPASKASLVLGLVLVLLGVVLASQGRWRQLAAWDTQAALYLADGVPMMTTLDAYYGLRLARQWAGGRFEPDVPAVPRHFSRPRLGEPDNWQPQREPSPLPLLSRLIAMTSSVSGLDIDRAALVLPALLSSLFMLPLFLVFWQLGAPAAGLMAGLVGTCCTEYLSRTGIGWSDTDQLNLLFPWLLACLFLQAGRTPKAWRVLAWCALSGLVNLAFSQWYWKPGLALGLALVLGLHLRLAGIGWRLCLAATLAFVLCSGPAQFAYAWASLVDFGARYLWATQAATQVPAALRFADVWSTVSEVQGLGLAQTLAAVLPRAEWAALGGVFFLAWALPRWRALLPLLPWLLLGSLSLVGARRFTLYLAPFVGAGWGIAVAWLVQVLTKPRSTDPAATDLVPGAGWRAAMLPGALAPLLALAASALVFAAWFRPAEEHWRAQPPAVPAPVFSDLRALAASLPPTARLWTWWDLGFAIVDSTGLGVYHDGAVQFTPQTHMVAVSLARPDPVLLHDLVRVVDSLGNPGIRALAQQPGVQDLEALLSALRRAAPEQTTVPLVVAFTPDMLVKLSSIQRMAAPLPTGGPRPVPFGMVSLRCSSLGDDVLRCDGVTVDMRAGQVIRTDMAAGDPAGRRPLGRVVVVADGGPPSEQAVGDRTGLTVQLLAVRGELKAAYLLDEAAYASNLNQMYVLGRFDPTRFDQVYHRPLGLRAFRVLPAARPAGSD